MTSAEVKAALRKKKAPVVEPLGLSSGSSLLNLACTGRPDLAFLAGHVYLLVGDSNSGKTFLSLTCLAEASINPAFDDYRFIHDNVERGALMDFSKFFGSKMAGRLEPPEIRDGGPVYSQTIEDFYDHVDDNVKKGPCIYVLDSMDALSSEAELKKFNKNKKARQKIQEDEEGEEGTIKGSFGDGKAKANSAGLRIAHNAMASNGSILIVIFQSRDNIGFGAMFNPKTRSGGNAPTFYATLEIWSSVKERIKRPILKKERVLGTLAKLRIKKNRITGKDRSLELPIYDSTGIDETGSCVKYLIAENHWKGTKETVIAPEFDHTGSIDELVAKVEGENKENELRLLVAETWNGIENRCRVERKARY